MRTVTEKMVLYFILTVYYFISWDNASLVITLSAFILFFIIDVFSHHRIVLLAALVYTGCLFLDIEWIYYLPLLSFVTAYRYGRYSLITLTVYIVEPDLVLTAASGVIIYVSYLRAQLEAYETENKKIRDQLTSDNLILRKQHNELLKNHEKDIHMAGLNERSRIARDMHDALGHSLSSSILLIESLQYVKDEKKLRDSLGLLQERLKDGMDDIRGSIHHLYETSIDMEARIADYVEEMESYDVKFRYDVSMALTHEVKIDILNIVKESLTNIKKHSDASTVTILIKEQAEFITISIKDDGSKKSVKNNGMGLLSMQEVVEKYKGLFNTFYREGFTVHITLYKKGIAR